MGKWNKNTSSAAVLWAKFHVSRWPNADMVDITLISSALYSTEVQLYEDIIKHLIINVKSILCLLMIRYRASEDIRLLKANLHIDISAQYSSNHDDVIRWKHFLHYWPFVRGIHQSLVNSPHKGQRLRALMFSLICTWINGSVNIRVAGALRCHHAHYDVIVMSSALAVELLQSCTKPLISAWRAWYELTV